MTNKKSYRRYSPEFKREAIKRACEEGVTDAAVSKNWVSVPDNFGDGETSCICWAQTRFQDKAAAAMRK